MADHRHRLFEEHQYDGMVMSGAFPAHILDRVKDFKIYDDDILLATYPKAGTTWFQEVLWLLKNKADVQTANEVLQDLRVPFLEIDKGIVPLDIDILESQEPPRIIKTHLPYRFFEKQLEGKKTKVVLGCRNIKDTLVSLYHFYGMNEAFGKMTGPFEEFFELFRTKHLAFGDWFDYNLEYWEQRNKHNFFVLKYEDLQKDMIGTLKRFACFLEEDLNDEQFKIIAKHVAFDSMKGNKQVNKNLHPGFVHEISPFMRKGKVGDWVNKLTDVQNAYIDKVYKQRMEGSGLDFDFVI